MLSVAATPYQIHLQFTRMVKESPFSGLKNECLLQHLETFSNICGLIPSYPNSPDYVRLHLFHLSLAGDAKDWYKCIVPNSITSRAQLKTAFLETFYPTVRTQDWRKKIASFTQADEENLKVAWSRFKRMIRACPHHEYGENHLNTFFYDGLNDSTKAVLDSAMGGQLSEIPCNQVKAKIEEVAKNYSWGGARSKGLPRGIIDTSNLDTISAKIEVVIDKKLSKSNLATSISNSHLPGKNTLHVQFVEEPTMILHIAGVRIPNM